MTDIIEFPFRNDPSETDQERTIRVILCNPDIHNHMAAMLYARTKNIWYGQADDEFAKISDMEQQIWRDEIIKQYEQYAALTPAQQRWQTRMQERGTYDS
jgi:hypothetical protein